MSWKYSPQWRGADNMTTTNVLGIITTGNGKEHMIQQEPTDGTPENLTIYDLAGASKEIYDILKGQVIKRIQLQCSDGSILNYLKVVQDGKLTHQFFAGERIANSEDVYNLDVNVSIPVMETTVITIDTTD